MFNNAKGGPIVVQYSRKPLCTSSHVDINRMKLQQPEENEWMQT